MALPTDLNDFMTNMLEVDTMLSGSKSIKDAKDFLSDQLERYEISDAERKKMTAMYLEQIALPQLQLAAEIVKTAGAAKGAEDEAKWKALSAQAEVIKNGGFKNASLTTGLGTSTNDGSIDLANRKTLAELKKQYGYGDATLSTLGTSTGNGVIDWQIKGFERDMFYKIANIISQENQMLVQNDKAVYPFMVDIMNMSYEAMSGGKINVKTTYTGSGTTYEDTRVTTVNWNGSATGPNGLSA